MTCFTPRISIFSLAFCAAIISGPSAQSAIRITEFMSEGQGDLDSGNGGRRQREFFELTNLGASPVDVSSWSYNDNNTNDPHNFGPFFGSIAAGESVVFTQMTADAFRTHWGLSASVRVFSYLQASNLGNADTINIYSSFTQDASTLVDSVSYTSDVPGSGVSRNRPLDGLTGQFPNSQWLISAEADQYASRFAPTAVSFAPPYDDPARYRDLGNPGVYVPEPATWALVTIALAAGVGRPRSSNR